MYLRTLRKLSLGNVSAVACTVVDTASPNSTNSGTMVTTSIAVLELNM
jgi:hypothetical protein